MRQIKPFIFIILAISLFNGCSANNQPVQFDKPDVQVPRIEAPKIQRKGSLYSIRGGSLFSDKKDLQIGDIIQININEELKSDSKNTRDTSKSNNTNLGAGVFAGVGNDQGSIVKAATGLNKNIGLSFGTETENSFSGSATSKFDESLETTISAVIQEVYQNGNYLIKGSREIIIDGQKQKVMLSGVIRPYDITPDNTISSSQVANLQILFEKFGDERDSLNKGWGTSIIESIWPF
ncbi:MAG: flagellar basal body L-ring protein FlgH [Arcobacteraceae bacterium]|jgi:flagellar L-ring protein precursor FlgH|nr:flagellar basal body L-ring protein FlgH [Arcobacteraceae bacterium]